MHPNESVSHNRDMPLTIPVAHDFNCPWCWIGLFQVHRLQKEFGVEIDWKAYELFPEHEDWPDYSKKAEPENRPQTPSRLQLLLAAEHLEIPKVERTYKQRTHNAHEAVEYAKLEGVQDKLVEAIYRAFWEEGLDINQPDILRKVATGIVHDLDALTCSIATKRFKNHMVDFDEPAYARGVYNVPTFFIGAKRLAEQPYGVIQKAMKAFIADGGASGIYSEIEFPHAPEDRPYIYIDMVSTIDGKILSGDRDDSVMDLGSKLDHQLMRRLEDASDAVLIGAQTLRAAAKTWSPHTKKRIVVSRSGHLPEDSAFLKEGEAYIATSGSSSLKPPHGVHLLRAGGTSVDFHLLLNRLRTSLGIKRLLVMGGSELNAQLLEADLVDELFLTLAPKIKLGRNIPTYAGGDPLDKHHLLNFNLVEHHSVENEVFLRYRRERKVGR